MHIHFVCRGNAYRSRLAEAYLRSRRIPGVHVSSSGIAAESDEARALQPISWVAQRIMQHQRLVPYMTFFPTQTTRGCLAAADLVIFMEAEHLEFARHELGYAGTAFQVWEIPDTVDIPASLPRLDYDLALIHAAEATYARLVARIDNLIQSL